MTLTLKNFCAETSTTTGTGSYLLGGVVSAAYRPIADVGNGSVTPYIVTNADLTKSEWGFGTYDSGANTLARTTILGNYLGTTAAISWAAGTKTVHIPDLKELHDWITYNNTGGVSAVKFAESAAPSTPATGYVSVYAKTDGILYSKDDAGAESALSAAGSQPLDATLTAFAALTIAANSVTIGSGADAFSQVTFAANTFPARASTGNLVAKPITDFALTFLDDTDATTARATLGLTIGTNVQAYDAQLADIAGITFAQGDVLYFNGSNLVQLAPGTNGHYLKTQGAAANPVWAAVPGGGDMLAANNLSDVANAATSKTNLGLGVGDLPQFTGLNLGHATDTTITRVSAGVIAVEGSNVLLASGLGSVSQAYDATLAAIAAYNTNGLLTQTAADTFTGRTLTGTANQITVTDGNGVSGNPTLSLPSDVLIPTVLTVPNAGLHILDTNASHDLIISPGSDLTADRTLTITTGDASRTVTISADATISGSNTGDQTITLTGDVTGSGTGSFAATIANGAVTAAKTSITGTPTGTKVLRDDWSWAAFAGGGDALVASPLSQFAATTSAQLAGVISDETGSGALVFATSPTLVTPILGTPTSGTLTNCTGLPVAGIAASTSTAIGVGSIELGHATDTSITRVSAGVIAVEGVTVPTAASTTTFTNKRITKRIGTEASSATSTPTADSVDQWNVTALAVADAFAAPTGTPTDGQHLIIRIKDNGTARGLTWNAIYRAGTDVALPSTTALGKTMYLGFIYNDADSKWDLLASTGNI